MGENYTTQLTEARAKITEQADMIKRLNEGLRITSENNSRLEAELSEAKQENARLKEDAHKTKPLSASELRRLKVQIPDPPLPSEIGKLVESMGLLFDGAPDCGDNSCAFAPKKGGMRTNGGCRCLPREMKLEDRRFFTLLFREARKANDALVAQSAKLADQVAEVEKLRVQFGKAMIESTNLQSQLSRLEEQVTEATAALECDCDAQFSGRDEAEYRARGCPTCYCNWADKARAALAKLTTPPSGGPLRGEGEG